MSTPKITTVPNFVDSSAQHQAAIVAGNDHFRAWQYNVADHLKDKTVGEIKQILKETAFPYAVLMENLINDFNLGCVIRTANCFNAKEVFYIGDRKRDKRAEMGVSNYTPIHWLATIEELIKLKERYYFVAIDNVPGSVPLSSYTFKENSLLVFGEEGVGITPAMRELCEETVHINQFGSVRSLNVGTASGIVMHEFVRQMESKNVQKA